MLKYFIILISILSTLSTASEISTTQDTRLKSLHLISSYGLVTSYKYEVSPSLVYKHGGTGFEYDWNYFLLPRTTIGLSFYWLSGQYNTSIYSSSNHIATLGIRGGYYFGNKYRTIIPYLSLESRLLLDDASSYEKPGILWNIGSGILLRTGKHIYLDFAYNRMTSQKYTYDIIKVGIDGLIY